MLLVCSKRALALFSDHILFATCNKPAPSQSPRSISPLRVGKKGERAKRVLVVFKRASLCFCKHILFATCNKPESTNQRSCNSLLYCVQANTSFVFLNIYSLRCATDPIQAARTRKSGICLAKRVYAKLRRATNPLPASNIKDRSGSASVNTRNFSFVKQGYTSAMCNKAGFGGKNMKIRYRSRFYTCKITQLPQPSLDRIQYHYSRVVPLDDTITISTLADYEPFATPTSWISSTRPPQFEGDGGSLQLEPNSGKTEKTTLVRRNIHEFICRLLL
jgi:hypothetical protein